MLSAHCFRRATKSGMRHLYLLTISILDASSLSWVSSAYNFRALNGFSLFKKARTRGSLISKKKKKKRGGKVDVGIWAKWTVACGRKKKQTTHISLGFFPSSDCRRPESCPDQYRPHPAKKPQTKYSAYFLPVGGSSCRKSHWFLCTS